MKVRLLFIIFIIVCFSCNDRKLFGEEKISYNSITNSARSGLSEARGTILFDEDGIVKYFNKKEPAGMTGKTNCEIRVVKVEDSYHVYEDMFVGFLFIIKEDKQNNEILLLLPEQNRIRARCKISGDTLVFTWDSGKTGFEYVFNENNFKSRSTEYVFDKNRLAGFIKPNDDTVYEITKKSKKEYEISIAGDFGFSTVTIEAEVNRKTMVQNAINLCIVFQHLYFYCIPFLVGRY